MPKCPRSVYAVTTLMGGGQHAYLSLNFVNVGPQTSDTESCFNALTTYAVPRYPDRMLYELQHIDMAVVIVQRDLAIAPG